MCLLSSYFSRTRGESRRRPLTAFHYRRWAERVACHNVELRHPLIHVLALQLVLLAAQVPHTIRAVGIRRVGSDDPRCVEAPPRARSRAHRRIARGIFADRLGRARRWLAGGVADALDEKWRGRPPCLVGFLTARNALVENGPIENGRRETKRVTSEFQRTRHALGRGVATTLAQPIAARERIGERDGPNRLRISVPLIWALLWLSLFGSVEGGD